MSQPPDQPKDEPAGDGAPPPPPNPYGVPPTQPNPYGSPAQPNPYGTPATPDPYGTPPADPSNPYGTPPPASPYGTPPPADPYGAQQPPNPYGAPPAYPGYGQPYSPYGQVPGSPESSSLRTQAIVSLVINIIAVVTCCGLFSIGGAICAGIAMGKADLEPQGARKLLRWSWGLLIANVVAWVLFIVVIIAIGVASDSSSGY